MMFCGRFWDPIQSVSARHTFTDGLSTHDRPMAEQASQEPGLLDVGAKLQLRSGPLNEGFSISPKRTREAGS
jgi:hypothetical protein